MFGGPDGPDPAFGAPDPKIWGGGAGLAARGAVAGGLRAARFDGGCGFGEGDGGCTVTGGRGCASGVDWASAAPPSEMIPSSTRPDVPHRDGCTRTSFNALVGLLARELDIASMPSLSNAGERYVSKSMMSI